MCSNKEQEVHAFALENGDEEDTNEVSTKWTDKNLSKLLRVGKLEEIPFWELIC